MTFPVLGTGASLFAGTGILALITLAWGHVRTWATRFTGLFIMHIDGTESVSEAVEYYCWNSLTRTPSGFRTYIGRNRFVRPKDAYMTVAFEQLGKQAMLFWRGWIPMMISLSDNHVKISYIRGTLNPDQLVDEAVECMNGFVLGKTKDSRFATHIMRGTRQTKAGIEKSLNPTAAGSSRERLQSDRPLRWTMNELGAATQHENALDRMALTPEIEGAIREAREWFGSQAWHKQREIPWRRGWLLHGVPGTGKTSLVRAIAQVLDLPVYSFDLPSMTNHDFGEAWSTVRSNAPCIALMEDIDNCFDQRTNITGTVGDGLTFDALLNAIGGIEASDGVFTMASTNKLSTIDPALSRPGRLDRILELPVLTEAGRVKIAQRILDDTPELIAETVAAGDGDSGAKFQERCASLALRIFWERRGSLISAAGAQIPNAAVDAPGKQSLFACDRITHSKILDQLDAGSHPMCNPPAVSTTTEGRLAS